MARAGRCPAGGRRDSGHRTACCVCVSRHAATARTHPQVFHGPVPRRRGRDRRGRPLGLPPGLECARAAARARRLLLLRAGRCAARRAGLSCRRGSTCTRRLQQGARSIMWCYSMPLCMQLKTHLVTRSSKTHLAGVWRPRRALRGAEKLPAAAELAAAVIVPPALEVLERPRLGARRAHVWRARGARVRQRGRAGAGAAPCSSTGGRRCGSSGRFAPALPATIGQVSGTQ